MTIDRLTALTEALAKLHNAATSCVTGHDGTCNERNCYVLITLADADRVAATFADFRAAVENYIAANESWEARGYVDLDPLRAALAGAA